MHKTVICVTIFFALLGNSMPRGQSQIRNFNKDMDFDLGKRVLVNRELEDGSGGGGYDDDYDDDDVYDDGGDVYEYEYEDDDSAPFKVVDVITESVAQVLESSTAMIEGIDINKIGTVLLIPSFILNGATCIGSLGVAPGVVVEGSTAALGCTANACSCAAISLVMAIKSRSNLSEDENNQVQQIVSDPLFASGVKSAEEQGFTAAAVAEIYYQNACLVGEKLICLFPRPSPLTGCAQVSCIPTSMLELIWGGSIDVALINIYSNANGKLVSYDLGTDLRLRASALLPRSEELWTMIFLGGKTIALLASNNKYVSIDLGDGTLFARADIIGPSEKFEFIQISGLLYALKADNGNYVTVELGETGINYALLRARSSSIESLQTLYSLH